MNFYITTINFQLIIAGEVPGRNQNSALSAHSSRFPVNHNLFSTPFLTLQGGSAQISSSSLHAGPPEQQPVLPPHLGMYCNKYKLLKNIS